MMDVQFDYEQDTTIDPDALDTEWLEQPRLMMRYSKFLANARRELEQAKERLDIVRAELDKEIRTDPEKFGIVKVTEGAINSTILTDTRFQNGQKELNDAQYEVNMAQGAVRAVEGKKDALENLVRLHGQQYFAGPRVPRDLSKEWEQKQQQESANKKVKIKRRK